MKCPVCGSGFRLFEWRSNSEPVVMHGRLVGFLRGESEASFQCNGCSAELKLTRSRDVNKALESSK